MAIDVRAVDQVDTEARARSPYKAVDFAGNDQNLARPNLFEVAADVHFHANFRVVVQPGRKGGCEVGGHVLNDDHAWRIERKACEKLMKSLDSASGDTNGDDLL